MKHLSLLLAFLVSSCSGMKVLKNPPPAQEPSKPGLTFNGPAVGPITVQKVGFWCDAKQGFLTFGSFGPTEPEAKAGAQDSCRRMFKDGACEIAACKPVQE